MLRGVVALKRVLMVGVLLALGAAAVLAAVNALTTARSAEAQGNPAPAVIPALSEWHGGSGFFALDAGSRIVVDTSSATQLQSTAQTFAGDLALVIGRTLPVVVADTPAAGDLVLTLRNSDTGIGSEGYNLGVAAFIVLSANTSTGIFYGTRSILQILAQDAKHAQIARGIARDYAMYGERGFMLDAGRKFFTLGALEDYVKFMAWYKMNDFHIHFNDNQIDAGMRSDWMHAYAAFRLNSPRFPGLAARDGSYSKQDMRQLQDLAAQYHVTITPEIDVPAHALALTQYRPDLANPTNAEFLDLGNPATYTFMNSIWDEFVPWFDAPTMDIGADEYDTHDADNYRRFINSTYAYLNHKGKTVRMWGSLSEMGSAIAVNPNIVIDLWDNSWANPADMVHQGFHVINANGHLLYIVPHTSDTRDFHDFLDTRALYDKWEPNIFDLANASVNLPPNDPHLLGGMFDVWNDMMAAVSDGDVYARVKPAMPTIAEKLWTGPHNVLTYDQFAQLAQHIGEAPGTHLPRVPWQGSVPAAPAIAAAPGGAGASANPALAAPPHALAMAELPRRGGRGG